MNEIEICLNCKKPRCNNCLRHINEKKKVTRIVQINPKTQEVIHTYEDYNAAAEAIGVSERTIRRVTHPSSVAYAGFLWRKIEVDPDDV